MSVTKPDLAGHSYIFLTLLFTVYGQIVLKWHIGSAGPLPEGLDNKLYFLLTQLLNPWIISGFVSAFLASLAWMAAMTRFDLSYAYPFMSLSFIVVMALSAILFHEHITWNKILGTLLVIIGLVVLTRR